MGRSKSKKKKTPEPMIIHKKRHNYAPVGGIMSPKWFHKIHLTPENDVHICFPETLLLVTDKGRDVGKTYTTVSRTEYAEKPCYLFHSGSSAKFNDEIECGTTITGFISPNLETIQEYTYEWAKNGDNSVERKVFLVKESKNKMVCTVKFFINGELKNTLMTLIPRNEFRTLLSEGSNILFQRLLISLKKTGDLLLRCLSNEGKVIRNHYKMIGSGYENVKGENIRVWGVKRSVQMGNGTATWDSLYNYFGRLVLRTQEESPVAMIPLWFKSVELYDEDGVFIGIRPPLLWACDMELHSKFLTKKDEIFMEYKSYLCEHQEIRAILSDFLQAVLFKKPNSVVDFAREYFRYFLPIIEDSDSDSVSTATTGSADHSSLDGEDKSMYRQLFEENEEEEEEEIMDISQYML